jgi:hypothetical protein
MDDGAGAGVLAGGFAPILKTGTVIGTTAMIAELTSLVLSAAAISFMSTGNADTVNVTLAELPEYGALTD